MANIMDTQLRRTVLAPSLVRRLAEVDEFKGRWHALRNLAPERLTSLQRIATVESVASSTRIEGVTLSDSAVHALLRGVAVQGLQSRDEQEVAGYAAVMELIFQSWQALTLTENHILQLHRVLLEHSSAEASGCCSRPLLRSILRARWRRSSTRLVQHCWPTSITRSW